jgi:hypothetical protein
MNGSLVLAHTAEVPTLGTGLFGGHLLGLQVGGSFHGPGGQAGGGGDRDSLHLGQIDIEPWPFFAEGAAGNDFSPTPSQLGNALQFFRGQLP